MIKTKKNPSGDVTISGVKVKDNKTASNSKKATEAKASSGPENKKPAAQEQPKQQPVQQQSKKPVATAQPKVATQEQPKQKPVQQQSKKPVAAEQPKSETSRPYSKPVSQGQSKPRSGYQKPMGQQQNKPQQPQKPEDLGTMQFYELYQIARRLGIVGANILKKDELVKKIQYFREHPDEEIVVHGVLEKLPDGFGFLRSYNCDYVSGPDDIYVSPSQIRRFALRTGDTITGVIRKPKDNEKYFALLKVTTINGDLTSELGDRPFFDRLSALHPDKKFNLDSKPDFISTRIMDLFSPIGKGQRGMIVAPPKAGKTMLLKEIALSLLANDPDLNLMILLVDERPEEVTDMKRMIKGKNVEVVSSTFDESANRHVQVAEITLEKSKRLVEAGKDVVILLDSITRLARAYNTTAPASGKVLTGGIDANALQRPKRFFGAARNTEEAGSLTILATAMVDTGSRMDEVIYEEFKGTGNMEMHLSRKLANRRVFPAFDLLISGTRRDDLLLDPDDHKKVWVLQKFLSTMNSIEGMEFLIDKMKKHKTNEDFLDSINRKAGSGSSGNGSSSNGNGSSSS
jgi:transcription termination factor Rho